MSSMVLSGDTSGAITLAAPAVSGTNTATLPAATGTVMVSGNMPAFSAYGSALQSATSSSFTKIAYNTKLFDTATAYDATTNYRFQPTVAGYYQVNASMGSSASVTGGINIYIYKTGSLYSRGSNVANSNYGPDVTISALVYLNGSSDYIEIYGYQNSGGALNIGSNASAYPFSACLVRSA